LVAILGDVLAKDTILQRLALQTNRGWVAASGRSVKNRQYLSVALQVKSSECDLFAISEIAPKAHKLVKQ
jgi:hypothetical protein